MKFINSLLESKERVAALPEETREASALALEELVKSFTKDVEAHTRKPGRALLTCIYSSKSHHGPAKPD